MPASKAGKHSGNKPESVAEQPRSRGRPARLSRDRILEAARLFKPQELTIPGLARAMNAPASSLYHHIDSLEDVLGQLAREAAKNLTFPPPDPKNWRKWLHAAAHCLLEFCREHLDASDGAEADVSGLVFEPFLETMEEAGFETAQALLMANAIAGWAFSVASMERRLESMGGRKAYDRQARENIASLEPSLAPRTFKAMEVASKLNLNDSATAHLNWLIRGIQDP